MRAFFLQSFLRPTHQCVGRRTFEKANADFQQNIPIQKL